MRTLLSTASTVLVLGALPLAACSSDTRIAGGGDDPAPISSAPDPVTPAQLDDLATQPAERSGPDRDGSLQCGDGAHLDVDSALCVNGAGEAVGPFPDGMREACRAAGGGKVCDGDTWPLPLATKARNAGATQDPANLTEDVENLCPAGTDVSARSGLCGDAQFVYAPFPAYVIEDCVALGGGAACATRRIPIAATKDIRAELAALYGYPYAGDLSPAWAAPKGNASTIATPPAACGDAAKLVSGAKRDYSKVLNAGRAWGAGPGRGRNGKVTTSLCATDASYFLDNLYPGFSNTKGYNLHRVDGVGADGPGFREALEAKGWQPIAKENCQAGDFAFTTEGGQGGTGPAPKNPKVNSWATRDAAHSAHVYLVSDNTAGALSAIDNQGANYVRNGLKPAYCMRAPGVAQGCGDFDCKGKSDGNYCGKIGSIFKIVTCEAEKRAANLPCATSKRCTEGPVAAGDLGAAAQSACK